MKEPLNTIKDDVTKKKLIEYLLSRTDIPDEATLRLFFNDEDRKFHLQLDWSYLAGAFSDEIVEFSEIESKWVMKDVFETTL